MSEIIFVLRHELYTILHRRSFQWMVFWLPLLSLVAVAAFSLLRQGNAGAPAEPADSPASLSDSLESDLQTRSLLPDGYVDPAGLVASMPEWIVASGGAGGLLRYPDESSGRQALQAGEARGLYLIPPDYLESGQLTYLQATFDPFPAFFRSQRIETLLRYNLLHGDPGLVERILRPLDLQVTILQPPNNPVDENAVGFLLPFALTMLLYMAILMSAGLLLASMQKERENRVLEILLTSLDPRRMFYGKISGLGLAGLLQTSIWLLTGYAFLIFSGRVLQVLRNFSLPPGFLLWTLLFFLLGYLLYASLMAAIGALVPNLREASQVTVLVNLPLILPVLASGLLISSPNQTLVVFMSFFPLTSPLAMVNRLAVTDLPAWQPALSAVLLALTAWLVVRWAAQLFRAQTLMQGQRLGWKTLRFLSPFSKS